VRTYQIIANEIIRIPSQAKLISFDDVIVRKRKNIYAKEKGKKIGPLDRPGFDADVDPLSLPWPISYMYKALVQALLLG